MELGEIGDIRAPAPDEPSEPLRNEGKTTAFLASLALHLAVLLAAAFVTLDVAQRYQPATYELAPRPRVVELPLMVEKFRVSDQPTESIGAWEGTEGGPAWDLGLQVALANPQVAPDDYLALSAASIEIAPALPNIEPAKDAKPVAIRGSGGTAVSSAQGAIDRLTYEILLSLEQRPTLVVWLLDQSASQIPHREAIRKRLHRVYEELGTIQSKTNHGASSDMEPLLSAVVAFGKDVRLLTPRPTTDVPTLRQLIANIETDTSGIEHIFGAVQLTIKKFHRYRLSSSLKPERNVMLVAFTDEAGDDQHLLDQTITLCRRWEMPVYIVGVPAPFGREETLVKWVDPDPDFDQTPQWGVVHQGPESLMVERLRLRTSLVDDILETLDSGFGPFALSRLCVETGGIYFTVHPNRREEGRVQAWEIDPFSAHISHFFSPRRMRTYRPEYVSATEYQRRLKGNRARGALVEAARQSWLTPMASPRRRFVAGTDAELAEQLTEAQKEAARLTPLIDRLHGILASGEPDRSKETSPRWKAGYDTAMGIILAMKVRTEGYNAILARAKLGLPKQEPRNNTWSLNPSPRIDDMPQLEALAEAARGYLQRVVDEHPDTPWALLASSELRRPFGWDWRDSYTELAPPAQNSPNNAPNPEPSDEQRRMLERPPTRAIPRL